MVIVLGGGEVVKNMASFDLGFCGLLGIDLKLTVDHLSIAGEFICPNLFFFFISNKDVFKN